MGLNVKHDIWTFPMVFFLCIYSTVLCMPREGNDYFVLFVSYSLYDVVYALFDVYDACNHDD